MFIILEPEVTVKLFTDRSDWMVIMHNLNIFDYYQRIGQNYNDRVIFKKINMEIEQEIIHVPTTVINTLYIRLYLCQVQLKANSSPPSTTSKLIYVFPVIVHLLPLRSIC